MTPAICLGSLLAWGLLVFVVGTVLGRILKERSKP
jgi:hypothetical protein